MRVLRVSHSAVEGGQRGRDDALAQACDLTLVAPANWPGSARDQPATGYAVHHLRVTRPGDVNRHRYLAGDPRLTDLVLDLAPDLIDLHEEPCSLVARQWLRAAGRADVPVVLYTAQNIDKRYPPPFAQYEAAALRRAAGVYACSRQAASVARGKGFRGHLEVVPLGYSADVFTPGAQSLDDEVLLGLVGRLVPAKGVEDAVEVLAAVHRERPARLVLIGDGPGLPAAVRRAAALGVAARLDVVPRVTPQVLAGWYRRMHVVLVPSRTTSRWVEQFGRVIIEARAAGAVVVGYASGAIPDVIGPCGLVVPEGARARLAAGTLALVREPGRWAQLRRQGLSIAAEDSWPAVARRHRAFYDAAVAESQAAAVTPRGLGAPARARARAEFGAPASVPGGERPFALPVLRDHPEAGRRVGQLLDAATAVSRRVRRSR